ncbi:HNH endonuclease [Colwellia sp. 1_MG-2023]|jgi:predicted restriction endonuclease|uniref:HNH endonuclease n=1 Tax=unclassified Colwellia TaxID=196834 RepID=UPI001C0A2495|nr:MULTISPECIES: HNH endonuclease [unclassified Colwellia]MBU2925234.1 HNH endonuclease [Colwellia sp. C2M11]MDO6651241.1 HNH endonuclease [Colwellia sp. 3_MG-2023]MDO6664336.1 HNH endonuclease [Colwellia sp. 2_MG-2023]MDO6688550.1 HNH endonuclease [Colwellia sp. 1_MG-2023]
MTLETIFVTQLTSIIGFIVVLFVLYRVLVAAKNATIESLKQQVNLQEQKLSGYENQQPDILLQVLQRRTEALEKELEERVGIQNQSPEEHKDSIERVKVIEEELKSNELVMERGLVVTRNARRITAHTRQYLLKMYNDTCQFCGLQDSQVMEMAHIKSFSSGGESSIRNMLLLCSNDHRLFDKGKWSINDDMSLLGKSGQLIISPKHDISKDSLKWHRETVLNSSVT